MKTKDKIYCYSLSVLLGILAALLVLVFSNYGMVAVARGEENGYLEACPVDFPEIESRDGIQLSAWPVNAWVGDVMQISIDPKMLETEQEYIAAFIRMPDVPENLDCLFLTDGWWGMRGFVSDRIDEHTLFVFFKTDGMEKFISLDNLYLAFVCRFTPKE